MADDYPTRISQGAQRINRGDPTVWAGRSGPITDTELVAHDRDGYHVIPELLPESEVQALRAELDRLIADPDVRADERTIVERKTAQVRSIFEVHAISAVIAELAADERIRGRAEQILGSDVYLHQSRINAMPGFVGNGSTGIPTSRPGTRRTGCRAPGRSACRSPWYPTTPTTVV